MSIIRIYADFHNADSEVRVLEKIGMTFDREIIFRGVAMDCYKIVK
jgi:hypothetical protein